MIILVDMDDTIEHLLCPWLNWLNKAYDKNVQESDVVSWDMQDAYPDLSVEQIFEPLDVPEFWDTVTPIEGAREALERFLSRGHKIYVVTSTPVGSVRPKMERVLFRYFPFFTFDDVIITSNKQLVRGDVLIDDGYHNMVGGTYKKILVDAPYNRKYDEREAGAVRVRNWAEIEAAIERIEEEQC